MSLTIRTALGVLLAALVLSCDSSTDPEDAPLVQSFPVDAAPPAPAGRVLLCYTGPDGLTVSDFCPVILWNDIEYWVYAYTDETNALDVIAFDTHDVELDRIEKGGTTHLYQIIVNQSARTIVIYGLGASTSTIQWSELAIGEAGP
jgi:hypothetical protein